MHLRDLSNQNDSLRMYVHHITSNQTDLRDAFVTTLENDRFRNHQQECTPDVTPIDDARYLLFVDEGTFEPTTSFLF